MGFDDVVESQQFGKVRMSPVKHWADKAIQALLSHHPFEVTLQEIPIRNLPPAFENFTIAQISDLHIDRWNAPVAEAAIDAANRLRADLVVCTGDVIAHGREYLGDVANLLGQFKARAGKMACLGNHDYSDGSGSYGVRRALSKAGFELLVNESTELALGRQKIQVAGADDLILGSQCLKATAHGLCEETATVLLSHNPENFAAMARFRPSLILSGHTHGGQIRLPKSMHRRFMGSPYLAGLYEEFSSRLYVNRGLGAAVFVHHWEKQRLALPSPRWWVRPEISVFRLVRAETTGDPRFTAPALTTLAG